MASDATTFFLGFAAIFGGLGWYLWHLERKVDDMRRRLDAVAPRRPRQGAGTSSRPGDDRPPGDGRQPRDDHPAQRSPGMAPSGPGRDDADTTAKKGQTEEWP